METTTESAHETANLGEKIGTQLVKQGRTRQAKILLLSGELGSGKTTFVQGLAQGLQIPHRLVSPTFILVKRYPLKNLPFDWFYHVDLYRIDNKSAAETLGLDEIFTDSASIVAIEWWERLEKSVPQDAVKIQFKQDEIKMDKRSIRIEGSEI